MNNSHYSISSTLNHSNLSTSGKNSPISFPVFSQDISRKPAAMDPSVSHQMSHSKSKLATHHPALVKQDPGSESMQFSSQSVAPVNHSFSHMDYYTHKLNNHPILNASTGNMLDPLFKQFDPQNNGFEESLGSFGNEKQFMGFPLDYMKDQMHSDMNNVLPSNFEYMPSQNSRNENIGNNSSHEVSSMNHDISQMKSTSNMFQQSFLSPSTNNNSSHFGMNNLALPSSTYSSHSAEIKHDLEDRGQASIPHASHSVSMPNISNPIMHSIASKSSLESDFNHSDAPPPSDPSDPAATPRPQNPRFKGDMYSPKWVRYNGQKKEGYCDLCEPGKWLQLKNSAFWYHKQFYHGICSTSGKFFCAPIRTRTKDNQMVEGLCHQCNRWVPVSSTKRRNSVLWFRHAQKCHVYHKPKPHNAKKLEYS